MLKMSQEELATAAGVGIQSVKRFEAGRIEPREDTIMRIQAALEERGIVFSNGDKPGVTLDLSRARVRP